MAPIKFEEEIKDKLEDRRIEPSAGSWDTLANRLDKEKTGSKNRFWYLAIAASFLLLLFTVLQVAKSPEEMLPEERFSNEEPTQINSQDVPATSQDKLFELQNEETNSMAEAETDLYPEPKSTVPPKVSTFYAVNEEKTGEKTSLDDKDLPITEHAELQELVATSDIDKSLINEVLEDSKKNESSRLETETDSLLKAAQKALFMDKAMNKNTTVVNADELLKEVENEVEPSLKSKVYEVFKDGFKKVKTAVVQRNN